MATFAKLATPLGSLPVDAAAIGKLAVLPQVIVGDGPPALEHALKVEFPFQQTIPGEVPVVPLRVGSATASEVAGVLARVWDATTLVIVSCCGPQRCGNGVFEEGQITLDDAWGGALGVRGLLVETQ